MIEEVSGLDYRNHIQDTILEPLGMEASSFEFIGSIEGASQSFDASGDLAPRYQYAAAGATGFSSSAADLSRLVLAVINDDDALGMSPATIASMRKPEAFMLGSAIWGLGTILYVPTASGDYIYGHDGANEPAINVAVRINPDSNDAYIMLATGHPTLASNIGSEWVLWQTGKPDFLSTEKALQSALWPAGIGGVVILFLIILISRRVFSRGRLQIRPGPFRLTCINRAAVCAC